MSEAIKLIRENEAFDLLGLKLSSIDDHSDESGIEEIIRKCDDIFDQIPKGAVVKGAEKKLIEAQIGLIHAICRAETLYYNEKRKRREVEAELAMMKGQFYLLKPVENKKKDEAPN